MNRSPHREQLPSDIQKIIAFLVIEGNPMLFEQLSLVCREWRSYVFTFFETKRSNKSINILVMIPINFSSSDEI